jgi:hypothetical protein
VDHSNLKGQPSAHCLGMHGSAKVRTIRAQRAPSNPLPFPPPGQVQTSPEPGCPRRRRVVRRPSAACPNLPPDGIMPRREASPSLLRIFGSHEITRMAGKGGMRTSLERSHGEFAKRDSVSRSLTQRFVFYALCFASSSYYHDYSGRAQA